MTSNLHYKRAGEINKGTFEIFGRLCIVDDVWQDGNVQCVKFKYADDRSKTYILKLEVVDGD